jgi:hypothetical protein
LFVDNLDIQRRLQTLQFRGDPPRRIVPLAGDASTRRYFRAFFSDGRTAIIMMQQHPGRNEEAAFLEVQRFLADLGLPVPSVYEHDPHEGLLVIEDAGDDLLESVVAGSGSEQTAALYREAVDLLLSMRRATAGLTSGCRAFDLAFDEVKLMQEMDFFAEHFIKGLCGRAPSPTAWSSLHEFFRCICSTLAAEPRILTHRDYHARNLLVHQGRLLMIDFQDARMGPAQYDLASLLRDSYVSLSEDLIDSLAFLYWEQANEFSSDPYDRFRYIFDVMSLQRNIKALGTFGYQVGARKAERYRSAIPRTCAYVAHNISRYSEFARFRGAIEDYISAAPASLRGGV